MSKDENTVRVWDPFVRFFHWALVLSFIVVWATGDDFEVLHEQLGYFMLVLIGLRIVWGLIGTKYARFSDFIYGIKHTIHYLRSMFSTRVQHYTGHNPVGGWMVIALFIGLILTGVSGIQVTEAHDSIWEELHEASANLTLLMVIVHLAGVFVASFIHNENLVKAMFTGKKMQGNDHV